MPYKKSEKQKEYQRNKSRERRKFYIKLCGGRCKKCGSTKLLEFHHRDRETKVFDIAVVWTRRQETIEKELNKCDLLCHICHHKETAKERGYYTAPHGTITAYKRYGCRCKDCRHANAEYEHSRRQKHS